MPNKTSRLTFLQWLLVVLLGFQCLSALYGGGALVIHPKGDLLAMNSSMLSSSPFGSFLIPGLILLVFLGIFPGFLTWALVKQEPFARVGSMLLGAALIIWIVVQIAIVGYSSSPPLQLIYGLLGVLILAVASLKATWRHGPSSGGTSP